jgi:glycosyltransferase involved in cell wall biosynthesis
MDQALKPLISVVIPVFNRAWQLRRALSSLQDQTYKNFEVIVSDDGSTEDIAAVVQEFPDTLKIRLLITENFGGPARPRNIGVQNAQGDWIAFLDSDDWWDQDRLKKLAPYLSGDVDILYHPLKTVKDDAIKKSREKRQQIGDPIIGNPLKYFALKGNPIPTSAVVVRLSALQSVGGMSEDRGLISVEDFDCWMTLAEKKYKFFFLNEYLGSYWIGIDAISAVSPKQLEAQKLLYQRHHQYFDVSYSQAAEARKNYVLGMLYLRLGDAKSAVKFLREASSLHSTQLRIKRFLALSLCIARSWK